VNILLEKLNLDLIASVDAEDQESVETNVSFVAFHPNPYHKSNPNSYPDLHRKSYSNLTLYLGFMPLYHYH
jgi:hypothetical protein